MKTMITDLKLQQISDLIEWHRTVVQKMRERGHSAASPDWQYECGRLDSLVVVKRLLEEK